MFYAIYPPIPDSRPPHSFPYWTRSLLLAIDFEKWSYTIHPHTSYCCFISAIRSLERTGVLRYRTPLIDLWEQEFLRRVPAPDKHKAHELAKVPRHMRELDQEPKDWRETLGYGVQKAYELCKEYCDADYRRPNTPVFNRWGEQDCGHYEYCTESAKRKRRLRRRLRRGVENPYGIRRPRLRRGRDPETRDDLPRYESDGYENVEWPPPYEDLPENS